MSHGKRRRRATGAPEAAETSPVDARDADRLADRDHSGVERLREAVYGTIVVLSVLAVLSEHERSAATAALTVAGTSLVLFFAQVYAGSVAERVQLGLLPGLDSLRRLAFGAWPVVAVTVWPLVLLGFAGLGLIETTTAITVAVWLAVAALGIWGWRAGQIGHSRLAGRLWSTALDLAVGLGIVALKVAFH